MNHHWSKQRERRTDALGRLDQDPVNVAESLFWTPSAKVALAVEAVARESHVPVAEVSRRWEALLVLLPVLRTRLEAGAPGLGDAFTLTDLVRLSWLLDDITQRIIAWREVLPTTVALEPLVGDCLPMLTLDVPEIKRHMNQGTLGCGGKRRVMGDSMEDEHTSHKTKHTDNHVMI